MSELLEQYKPFTDIKVVGLMADEAACGNYRVKFPLEFLQRGGAKTSMNLGYSNDILQEYDYILAQRQHSKEIKEFLKRAKWYGKTVVYELDDNVHAIHPNSPVFDSYKPGSEILHSIEDILHLVDGMFTTSAELSNQYSKYNKKTWVLPNCIDIGLRDWDTRPERDERLGDKIVIGWAGSITHQDDAMVMGASLKNVLEKYPQTIFAVCSAYQTMGIFIRDLKIPEDRVVRIEPVSFEKYPQILPQFDISLAPLVNTTFNLAKSDLKLKEAGAWGIPYVATMIAPYARFHTDTQGQGGYLATGVKDWEDKISQLVEDEEDRRTKGAFIGNYIRTECSMEANAFKWAHALREAKDLATFNPEAERKILVREKAGRNDPCPCGCGQKYKKCARGQYGAWG